MMMWHNQGVEPLMSFWRNLIFSFKAYNTVDMIKQFYQIRSGSVSGLNHAFECNVRSIK